MQLTQKTKGGDVEGSARFVPMGEISLPQDALLSDEELEHPAVPIRHGHGNAVALREACNRPGAPADRQRDQGRQCTLPNSSSGKRQGADSVRMVC